MHEPILQPLPAARWPVGHIGWSYAGLPEFEGRVASFLAEGHARGERQVFIADEPKASLWPRRLVGRGDLLIFSTVEVYGQELLVDPAEQRTVFEATLADALALGYTGLRVAADNTSLIADPDRLEAWMRWEGEADCLMRARPVTGLCAFDRTRSSATTVESLLGAHRTAGV